MARPLSRPRYFPSRKGYYVTFNGVRHCLAVGTVCADCQRREKQGSIPSCAPCKALRLKADQVFAQLRIDAEVEHAEDNSILYALLNRYLVFVRRERKTKTYRIAKAALASFNEECGHLRAKELKPFHVDDWLTKLSDTLGDTTRSMWFNAVNACINWAVKKGYISKNPVGGGRVDRPHPRSRTAEVVLTPEEHRAMLDLCERQYQPRYYKGQRGYYLVWRNRQYALAHGPQDEATLKAARERLEVLRVELNAYDPFGVVLRMLEHTGARPGEIYHATADRWNADLGAFVYPPSKAPQDEEGFTHKTARKGRERVVYVSDPTLRRIVDRLCRENPVGPVFRNQRGTGWTDNAVWWQLDSLKKKTGLDRPVTPYSYRHTSITNMILAGHPAALVAEVHGTSVEMISAHYQHLDSHRQSMAQFFASAKAGQTPPLAGGASSAAAG